MTCPKNSILTCAMWNFVILKSKPCAATISSTCLTSVRCWSRVLKKINIVVNVNNVKRQPANDEVHHDLKSLWAFMRPYGMTLNWWTPFQQTKVVLSLLRLDLWICHYPENKSRVVKNFHPRRTWNTWSFCGSGHRYGWITWCKARLLTQERGRPYVFVAITIGNAQGELLCCNTPEDNILFSSFSTTLFYREGRRVTREWIGVSSSSSNSWIIGTFDGLNLSGDQATTFRFSSDFAKCIFSGSLRCWTFFIIRSRRTCSFDGKSITV